MSNALNAWELRENKERKKERKQKKKEKEERNTVIIQFPGTLGNQMAILLPNTVHSAGMVILLTDNEH